MFLCSPHQYARKSQGNAFSRYQPRFHAEPSTVFGKTPLNSKPIPQFDSTNYLALISRTCSTRIRCQTFSNSWVEQNCPRLSCDQQHKILLQYNEIDSFMNLVPWTYKPPFRFTAIFITGNISICSSVTVHGVQLR